MGVALLIALAFMPAFFLPLRVRLIFTAAITARLAIAGLNATSSRGLIGSTLDAEKFISLATERAENPSLIVWDWSTFSGGAELFLNGYASMMRLLGTGELVAHCISVLGASFCFVLLIRCWLLIVPGDFVGLNRLVAVYAIVPTLLTNQSYVLREVWQSLAVLLLLYAVLRWRQGGLTPMLLLCLASALVLGASMHHALPLTMLALTVFAVAIARDVRLSNVVERPNRILGTAAFCLLIVIFATPILLQNSRVQGLTSGTLLDDTRNFGEIAVQAADSSRAFYGTFWNPSQPWTIVPSFFAYQFAPFPWQLSSISDLVLAAENLFRFWLLWSWWKARKLLDASSAHVLKQMLRMWLLLEAVWSIGTVNWGTAARHHVMGVGLLLIIGFASQRLSTAQATLPASSQPRWEPAGSSGEQTLQR